MKARIGQFLVLICMCCSFLIVTKVQAQSLDLDSKQKQEIAAIKKQRKQLIMQKKRELQQARRELKQAMDANKTDQELLEYHANVNRKQKELSELQFDTALSVRRVLTPKQRAKVKKLQKKRLKRLKNK